MRFVQIVDLHTKNFEELQRLNEGFQAATEGRRTVRRALVTRDRNDPDHYLILVEFDSYESAMTNSNLPETQQFAQRVAELADEPPRFADLDVLIEQH